MNIVKKCKFLPPPNKKPLLIVKTTLEWWDSRLNALGIQTITYIKYPVSRLIQNKWNFTFLERFRKKKKTPLGSFGCIWVYLPFLWNPLVDFGDWHLFWTVRANRIEGEVPKNPPTRYHWGVRVMRTQFAQTESYVTLWKLNNWKLGLLLMDYQ